MFKRLNKIKYPIILLTIYTGILVFANLLFIENNIRLFLYQSINQNLVDLFRTMFMHQFLVSVVAGGGLILIFILRIQKSEQKLEQKNKDLMQEIALRENIEEALKLSESESRAVLECLPQVIFETDLYGNIKYSNLHGFEQTGYCQNDVEEGINIFDLFPVEEHERAKANMARILSGGSIEPREYNIYKKNKELFPALIYTSIVTRKGVPIGFRGVVIDITDRKRMEKELESSRESFYNIVERTDEGIIVAEKSGIVRYLNKSAAYHLNKTKEELINMDFGFPLILGKASELEIHVGDISKKLVEIHVVGTRWENDDAYLITLRDITEKRLAERIVRESEEKLQTILSDIPTGIVIVDQETHDIVDVNPQAALLIGASPDSIVGRKCHNFICPNEVGKCPVDAGNEGIEKAERKLLTITGEMIPILKTVVPIVLGGKPHLLESFVDISDLKKAEEKIMQQNIFLQNVLESLTHPFYVIDVNNYTIKMANSAAKLSAGNQVMTCYQLTHHSDIPCNGNQHPCPVSIIKQTKRPITLEHVHYDKDNNERVYEVHGYPILNKDGEVEQIIEYSFDITERKQFETALKQERDKTQKYLDVAGVILIALDVNGTITLMNRRGCELTGYTEEELIGQNWFDKCIPKEDVVNMKLHFANLMLGITSGLEYFENPVRTKTGEIRYFSWYNSLLKDEEGSIYGTLSSGEDITERKKTEEALRESEQRFERAIRGTADAIWEWDIETHKVWYAPRVWEQLGYRENEFPMQFETWFNKIHADDKQRVTTSIKRHIENNVSYDVEYRIQHKNGNYVWLRSRGVAYRDTSGKTIKMAGSNQDITDRKIAEQDIKEKEKYLRTIMSTIQTGVILSDEESRRIVDANPYALKILGKRYDEVIGLAVDEYFNSNNRLDSQIKDTRKYFGDTFILKNSGRTNLRVRLSKSDAIINGRKYIVNSFLDITDIQHLLEEQEVNIDLAKRILNLVNSDLPRNIDMNNELEMFIEAISMPSKAAGGDHYLIRRLNCGPNKFGKTNISLKDQSGHEVNCILRSIITDLMHNAILYNINYLDFEETVSKLNDELCKSGLFEDADFLTAMNIEIDNNNLNMKYLSCGHPPLIIIRKDRIISLPGEDRRGQNLPLGSIRGIKFNSGIMKLQNGDKILIYTDGLTDIPIGKKHFRFTHEDLIEIIRKQLSENENMKVGKLIRRILSEIAEAGDEEIIPHIKNSSNDDVSIIGIEIEDQKIYDEEIIYAENIENLDKKILNIHSKLADIFQQNGYCVNESNLLTVLEEGIVNAWKHGNREDSSKPITLRWRFANDLHLEILDEGSGFDYRHILDPTSVENRLKQSGRGIFMMKYFANNIRWKKNGSHLMASFANEPSSEFIKGTKSLMRIWQNV